MLSREKNRWDRGEGHDQIRHSSSVKDVDSLDKDRGSVEEKEGINSIIYFGIIRKLKKMRG